MKRDEDNGSNNNTWNDSNETPFPSLSGMCPLNGSTNDDENAFSDLKSSFRNRLPLLGDDEPTPTNENRSFTPTVHIEAAPVENEIKFQLGGAITSVTVAQKTVPHSSGPLSIESSSTMTNSTIIFMEVNKLASELQNLSPTDSLASLDLDNIRPPSVMDCVSLSTVTCEFPASPQMSRQRKTSIPTLL